MKLNNVKSRSILSRYLLIIPLCLALLCAVSVVKAQDPPKPPAGGPPPPPSPSEVLDKINPFKKKKGTATKDSKDSKTKSNKADKSDDKQGPPPPPPPNPLDLFKKKNKAS